MTLNAPPCLRRLREHPSLLVRATETCNSACIIILMSGERRSAPRDLVFGLHATGPITKITGVYNVGAMNERAAQADSFLISRGIPKRFVERARSIGPEKLFNVTSIEMTEEGALTQLTDGGVAIPLARAKWLYIVDSMTKYKMQKEAITLFKTITEVAPDLAEKSASLLWAKFKAGDATAIADVARTIVREVADRSMPAAGDVEVHAVVAVTSSEIDYIRSKELWDTCNGLLAGKGFGSLKVPPAILAADYRAVTGLLRSAADRDWAIQEVRPGTARQGEALTSLLAEKMLHEGEDLRQIDGNPKIACNWSGNLFAAIAAKPASEAANLYRWLATLK